MTLQKKKVLIIAYYWPPSGGSGVQRWLKFVKYLPQYGWEPHVFTPENPSFDVKDDSLLKDVPPEAEIIRFPIWEPYELFFKFLKLFGKRKRAKPTDLIAAGKKSFFQQSVNWVRGNFFIPDPRIFWVKPSFEYLLEYLQVNQIKTIITTGPPHSLHLIGWRLKKKEPSIRWIADFRDPWSEWGLLDSLNVGARARKKHRRFEQNVLSTADEIITITPFYVRQFEKLSNRKVHLLTNGFDEDDFADLRYERTDKFVIRHVGIVNEKCDLQPFFDAVISLAAANPDFASKLQIEFLGDVHPRMQALALASDILRSTTRFCGHIPHNQLLHLYGSSSLLLLVLTGYKDAEGYLPGKLFEYFATGLPILGIGPVEGDAGVALRETGAGEMAGSYDVEAIRNKLHQFFKTWQAGPRPPVDSHDKNKFSRKSLTGTLVELLRSST